jgi:hypothetical protein
VVLAPPYTRVTARAGYLTFETPWSAQIVQTRRATHSKRAISAEA